MPSHVPTITELLDAAQHSAVHLEMRDVYAIPRESEEFARWRRTGERRNDPESAHWRGWTEAVRRTVARGVAVQRARVVSEPVSEYIRYEHAGTAVNVAAGEEVRWLPRRQGTDIALPGNDFWLFDGRLVRIGHFGGQGESTGHEVSEEPALVKLCQSAFETVWERAIPHADYRIR